MNLKRRILLGGLVALLMTAPLAADEKEKKGSATAPVVVSKASFAINVPAGDYQLLQVVQDFPPGAGVATHRHGGNVVVTVLSGAITLRQEGGERVVNAGEQWTEAPGMLHSAVNTGNTISRVVASFLLPKGAEVTTMEK